MADDLDLQQTGGQIRVGRRFRWPDDYFRGDWILTGQVNDVRDGRGYYVEGKTTQMSLTQVISRNSIAGRATAKTKRERPSETDFGQPLTRIVAQPAKTSTNSGAASPR